jgi:hypothetical protein
VEDTKLLHGNEGIALPDRKRSGSASICFHVGYGPTHFFFTVRELLSLLAFQDYFLKQNPIRGVVDSYTQVFDISQHK